MKSFSICYLSFAVFVEKFPFLLPQGKLQIEFLGNRSSIISAMRVDFESKQIPLASKILLFSSVLERNLCQKLANKMHENELKCCSTASTSALALGAKFNWRAHSNASRIPGRCFVIGWTSSARALQLSMEWTVYSTSQDWHWKTWKITTYNQKLFLFEYMKLQH